MVDDFSLLESMLIEDVAQSECVHEERIIETGMFICVSCGFSEKIADGQTYTSHKMYKRATRSSNISHILEQKGFDSRVSIIANQIYNVVVDDEHTKRTGNQKSVCCACAFEACKVLGRPVDYSQIYEKFNIKKRSALKRLWNFTKLFQPQSFLKISSFLIWKSSRPHQKL